MPMLSLKGIIVKQFMNIVRRIEKED